MNFFFIPWSKNRVLEQREASSKNIIFREGDVLPNLRDYMNGGKFVYCQQISKDVQKLERTQLLQLVVKGLLPYPMDSVTHLWV